MNKEESYRIGAQLRDYEKVALSSVMLYPEFEYSSTTFKSNLDFLGSCEDRDVYFLVKNTEFKFIMMVYKYTPHNGYINRSSWALDNSSDAEFYHNQAKSSIWYRLGFAMAKKKKLYTGKLK